MVFRFLIVLALGLFSSRAWSQVRPINLEFPERPVVNSNRVIGLGGAYVGVAEGADGHLYNPASFASRFAYTRDDIWDYDWTIYWLNLPRHRHPDIRGKDADSFYLGGGLDFKIAGFGAGVHVFGSTYRFTRDEELVELSEALGVFGFAYAIPYIDTTIGASIFYGNGTVTKDSVIALDANGAGNNVGFLWSPEEYPFRIGMNLRFPILNTTLEEVDPALSNEFLPEAIHVPGQLVFGASYMFWERKYNPKHTWGLKQLTGEETSWGRRYILLAYDIVLTGSSPDAISVNGFLNEEFEESGTENKLTMRVGIESEVVSNLLRFRTGYYPEPSRIAGRLGRHHWTAGADLRVPVFIDWRLNGAIDISKEYLNVGVGIGFWH